MKKNLLLFGVSGDLGREAATVFLQKDYDKYYFFSRKDFIIESGNKKVEKIIVEDLSDSRAVEKAFSKIKADPDDMHFLFSAIGGYVGGKTIADTEYEEFLAVQKINLNISFMIAKFYSKLAAGSLGGSICFTSAFASLRNDEMKAAYGASKSALNYLVKSLAVEGKRLKFSANAVAPFILDTPENREWMSDPDEAIKPADLAELVHDLFRNYRIISGNIIELPGTLR